MEKCLNTLSNRNGSCFNFFDSIKEKYRTFDFFTDASTYRKSFKPKPILHKIVLILKIIKQDKIMLKTFTLEKVVDEQLTETEGKRIFYLIDENGDKRTVWGSTLLNDSQQPVSISTNKKREYPLIQCLFNSKVQDTIKIEFTQYNSVFNRKSMSDVQQTVEDIMKEMKTKPMRVGSLLQFVDYVD